MRVVLASFFFATLTISCLFLTNNQAVSNAQIPVVVPNNISWHWGECDAPPGNLCTACKKGGCIIVAGRMVADGKGTGGCDANGGASRGDSCPGIFGWCKWESAFCGELTHGDCGLNPTTFMWEGYCKGQGSGCAGCKPAAGGGGGGGGGGGTGTTPAPQ